MTLWFNLNNNNSHNNLQEFKKSLTNCQEINCQEINFQEIHFPETTIRNICLLLIRENRQTQIEGYKLFGKICLTTFTNVISKYFDKKIHHQLIDSRYVDNVLLLYMHYGYFRDLNETSGRLMIQNINEPINIWRYITRSNLDEFYIKDAIKLTKDTVNIDEKQIKELLDEYDDELCKIILNLPINTINLIKNKYFNNNIFFNLINNE
jgi:hypothetical protein